MDTIIKVRRHIRFYAAAFAMFALVITVFAVSATGNTTQAQNSENVYGAPIPCGPGDGAGMAFQPEPHEITMGHYALFDSYWEWQDKDPNVGVMHTNECPPKMVTTKTDDGFGNITVKTTRAESNIDIDEAIFHITDSFSTTVVDNNADVTSGQLSLEDYPEVGNVVDAGDTVWWLRLDDPDTSADETSDLTLGFSTALFDKKYWKTHEDTDADGNPAPMRYMFEAKRYPSYQPSDNQDSDIEPVPEFFTYEAPSTGSGAAVNIWDSTEVHLAPMEMDPGEYKPVQWIFTEPGTYILSVHLFGHVRDTAPADAGESWERIHKHDESETGEVKKYTFQVGPLAEMEPPLFGINPSIKENSPAGTKIGDPIPVYRSEADTLYYNLTGLGKEAFTLIPTTDPHAVQIVVAEGADLDYETERSYDLILDVTDNVDHEDNKDTSVDDILAVNIDVEDIPLGLSIQASNNNPRPGDTVTFTGVFHDLDMDDVQRIGYTFRDSRGSYLGENSHSVYHAGEATETIGLTASILPKGGTAPGDLTYLSASLRISWSNP